MCFVAGGPRQHNQHITWVVLKAIVIRITFKISREVLRRIKVESKIRTIVVLKLATGTQHTGIVSI